MVVPCWCYYIFGFYGCLAPVITISTTKWSNRRLGCVGVPIPGADIRILDPTTLEELPNGSEGEVTMDSALLLSHFDDLDHLTCCISDRSATLGQMLWSATLTILKPMKKPFCTEMERNSSKQVTWG
jgi:acyl-CoA synthetase (AMP-forming)/AMP-acid ligase II